MSLSTDKGSPSQETKTTLAPPVTAITIECREGFFCPTAVLWHASNIPAPAYTSRRLPGAANAMRAEHTCPPKFSPLSSEPITVQAWRGLASRRCVCVRVFHIISELPTNQINTTASSLQPSVLATRQARRFNNVTIMTSVYSESRK